ncbi:class F sortase [Actinoplanes sp. URMC 104]|uniref:class F sortase n=1 Tax=Actinoplanes sp. URMC 104 TaxID=3423409 RepID=UPI003F1A942D
MAADDTDTPLIVRLSARPGVVTPEADGDADGGGEAEEQRGWIARGVAKVVKPGTIRARAYVPGALSLPRPKPSRRLRLGQPSTPFPRRVFPQAEPATTPAPPLRAAIPADPGHVPHAPSLVRDAVILEAGRDAGQLPKDRSRPVPKKGFGRRAVLPAAAAVVAAFAAGTAYLAVTDRTPADLGRWAASPAATQTATTEAATTGATARPAGDPFGSVVAAPQGPPTRLRIGAIKVDTPLETLRIGADGALQPPQQFARAGWYADGTAPGDTGPAVIAGHVDSRSGPAVFYRLRDLTAGDRIEVVRGGATVGFTVTAIRWYPKSEFPTEEVYGPTPDRQLRLITCGGVFDHTLRSYRDNLVVYAVAG